MTGALHLSVIKIKLEQKDTKYMLYDTLTMPKIQIKKFSICIFSCACTYSFQLKLQHIKAYSFALTDNYWCRPLKDFRLCNSNIYRDSCS